MTQRRAGEGLGTLAADVVETATGRRHREDPIVGPGGGPAGNAKLTAWTGLLLLVLFLAELVTLLDVHGLISWHVAIGALLVPPALVKTATTGWRILRYYTGNAAYREAGPPPTALRVLGPLVVLSTLAVLATGIVLVLIGESSSRRTIAAPAGFRVDALTLHKGAFVIWGAATGLHTLGRIVPALHATVLGGHAAAVRRVPGRRARLAILVSAMAVAGLTAVLLVGATGPWSDHGRGQHVGPAPRLSAPRDP